MQGSFVYEAHTFTIYLPTAHDFQIFMGGVTIVLMLVLIINLVRKER